jgi:hypothetical protein
MSHHEGARDVLRNIIFTALVEAPSAWQTTSELARSLGFDHEVLCDELASMDVAGLIVVWERPDDVAVSVSTLAARARGLSLVQGGAPGVWCWRKPSAPAPRPVGAPTGRAAYPSAALRQPPRGPQADRRSPDFPGSNPLRPTALAKHGAPLAGMS